MFDPRDNFNEFQWEQEIRRDDRRINCYFKELLQCLDLPGEEALIFDKLAQIPDLVPKGESSGADWRSEFFIEDEEDKDLVIFEIDPKNVNHQLIEIIDNLCTEWNLAGAGANNQTTVLQDLGVSCTLGKLMVRLIDFFNAEETALRTSLGKRALSELDDAIGALRGNSDKRISIDYFIDELGIVRSKLVDTLMRH